ncbi:MAG: aminotransferase class III-fold pyridoxal phosphate-dependent enzyme [Chloroflexi bacterium]|nr:aminotransferase class III-fold pyridoxal phosphate-dependent enzyme [Chloroflexota bacterium]
MEESNRSLKKSFDYLLRAEQLIPALSQTFSKSPRYLVKGVYPVYVSRGTGSRVFDVDGNEYIDYIVGLGAVSLGYAYPDVDRAIVKQLKDGISFSLPHPLEVDLAELLVELLPCAEMVRFSKTGSDVTSAAIRAARAYTGREKVAYCGYHGWHEWYSVTTTRNKGIPVGLKDLVMSFQYNDIGSLEELFRKNPDQIAAVIMEAAVLEPPKDGYLGKVKELTHRNGAILIFDEIVTGFRMSLGGAQEYFGVTPDMATFGKGMANGMPLSAVVGCKALMKEFEEVFFSTTFGGETLSLAAAIATIEVFRNKRAVDHIWRIGMMLREGFDGIRRSLDIDARFVGFPCHQTLVIKDTNGAESPEVKSLFMQEMVKRGVLVHSGTVDLCLSHSEEDVARTLEAGEDALRIVRDAMANGSVLEKLEGEVFQRVFKRF